jgi:hypothetical protein
VCSPKATDCGLCSATTNIGYFADHKMAEPRC